MNPEESSPAAKPSVCYDFSGGYLASSAYALSSGTSAASMGLLARAYSRGRARRAWVCWPARIRAAA